MRDLFYLLSCRHCRLNELISHCFLVLLVVAPVESNFVVFATVAPTIPLGNARGRKVVFKMCLGFSLCSICKTGFSYQMQAALQTCRCSAR